MQPQRFFSRLLRPILLICFAQVSNLLATDPGSLPESGGAAISAPSKTQSSLTDLLALAKGLEIDPKVITQTDGQDTTIGIQYKYNRQLTTEGLSERTDVELSLHSEGLVVVNADASPNRLLTHGFQFSVIDLLPFRKVADKATRDEVLLLKDRITTQYYHPWKFALLELKELRTNDVSHLTSDQKQALEAKMLDRSGRMAQYVEQARALLGGYGVLEVDEEHDLWRLRDTSGQLEEMGHAMVRRVEQRPPLLLSLDLDANAETDQSFRDVQWVGSAQLSGSLSLPIFDLPFRLLRGGGPPKNRLNRNGGPYFWGGAALVDPSDNESYKQIALDDDKFCRAHAGVYYRTEVFSTSESTAIALEILWRYYHQFNAPAGIRQKRLDDTSYFRVTLLFPGNYFLEYTDGALPIDVEGSSTVSVGWRYNF